MKKTQCTSTKHPHKHYTLIHTYTHNQSIHQTNKKTWSAQICGKACWKRISFELSFELREGREIPQTDRQPIPDRWIDETERTPPSLQRPVRLLALWVWDKTSRSALQNHGITKSVPGVCQILSSDELYQSRTLLYRVITINILFTQTASKLMPSRTEQPALYSTMLVPC